MKEDLIKRGIIILAYNPMPQKGLKNFFRIAIKCHPPLGTHDMDYLIEKIEKSGENYE